MARVSSSQSFVGKLLKVLALSGAVVVAASNPYFGLRFLEGIKKDLERKKWRQFYQDLYRLKRQKRLNIFKNEDGEYVVELTKFGYRSVNRLNLDSLQIARPKHWDGCWRFFSFDIPAHKKEARHALLNKLKELGFILVQRSLWAHPFECQKELVLIAETFEVSPHVLYFSAEKVSGAEWLKKKYNRQNMISLI